MKSVSRRDCMREADELLIILFGGVMRNLAEFGRFWGM